MDAKESFLNLDGWAGRIQIPVEIISETPKRYRVRILRDFTLPNRNYKRAGDIALIPKYAISTK